MLCPCFCSSMYSSISGISGWGYNSYGQATIEKSTCSWYPSPFGWLVGEVLHGTSKRYLCFLAEYQSWWTGVRITNKNSKHFGLNEGLSRIYRWWPLDFEVEDVGINGWKWSPNIGFSVEKLILESLFFSNAMKMKSGEWVSIWKESRNGEQSSDHEVQKVLT